MSESAERVVPEWLVRWRERQALIDPDSVSRTMEPFGVVRRTPAEIARMAEKEDALVFVFVSGDNHQRQRLSRRLGRTGARSVAYSTSLAEARQYRGSPSEYFTAGLAWSIIRSEVSVAIRGGMSVVIDAVIDDPKARERFTQHCFTSGARGVIALCFTTMYEEGWDDDGFSGVIWVSG